MSDDQPQDDRHQESQDEIRSEYAVRPVVYIPLTILLMLVFGFLFFGASGGNIFGAVAGVILAPLECKHRS